MDLIPAIDLKDGRCVRLLKGKFDAVTDYSSDALGIAERYQRLGCQRLHVVDLDGAATGQSANGDIVQRLVKNTDLDIQLGGGIRSANDVEAWLQRGIKRCVLGSAAVTKTDQVSEWLARFGADSLVLALDVRIGATGTPYVTTDGWTKTSSLSLAECLAQYQRTQPLHLLCTDIDRDGAMTGPNTELYRVLVENWPSLAIQASGGVSQADDLHALRATGVAAAISGKALLEQAISEQELRPFLPAA